MSVQSREVLVIGAGIAGLTAARDLAIDGYDVAILEARERIGGRIWTSHELGLPADLGASWIHGFEDNPIARRHAIAVVRTNISSVTPARYRSMALYDEDGHRLSSGETAEMSEMMADYLDFVAAKQKEGHEKSMLAVEELFAASQGYDPDHRRRLTFIARTYLEHEWAGPRSDVSLLEHDKSLGFAGHDRVFPEGYAQITDRLAEGTDILLGDQEDELIGYMGSQDEDWPEIVNFHKIAGLPVLLAFSAGTAGEKNELRSNAELVECLMACLRKMYGQNIPEPVGHLVTQWNQDPFSLGSYSYVPVGSKQSLRRQIGTPVENRVFFAGEATSQFFPATVHGAFLSGVRAAYEIMLADAKADLMKDNQGEVDTYV
jgi:monoamine oxidase